MRVKTFKNQKREKSQFCTCNTSRDVQCKIYFQSLEECYVIKNWAIKLNF